LIQGGMGVGVSGWPLAREVASHGQLGVVSGTGLDTILVRRLWRGDPGGYMRRAMAAFPAPDVVCRVLKRYFRPDGLTSKPTAIDADVDAETDAPIEDAGRRYKLAPMPRAHMNRDQTWLMILANFIEVYLAKHYPPQARIEEDAGEVAGVVWRAVSGPVGGAVAGPVGINYLHKVQFPMLPSLYGALLAGVDVVLMGAGIPADIPEVLDRLSCNLDAGVTLDVQDGGDQKHTLRFDPAQLWAEQPQCDPPALKRPQFLAIVSSATLARALLKKAPGGIDGFVVEAPTAGGHNAPPRGVQQLSHRGEPIYGERDEVSTEQMAAFGVPFWLAGGCASPERFAAALDAGARGVQVGTAFAFCEESGLDPVLRRRFLAGVLRGESDVFTDPDASPTGFPFKVAMMDGTLAEKAVYDERPRRCDLGYLRRAYQKDDGTLGYRCPAEPVEDYLHKGGRAEDTVGRKCLCNALMANIGLAQRRDGYEEPPLLTAGVDVECLRPFISPGMMSYRARDVIAHVLPPAHVACSFEHALAHRPCEAARGTGAHDKDWAAS
jgi:nitronate monooxygenase